MLRILIKKIGSRPIFAYSDPEPDPKTYKKNLFKTLKMYSFNTLPNIKDFEQVLMYQTLGF